MKGKQILTKILAVIGTVLLWLPLLAAVVFCAVSLFSDGIFRLDHMFPAEVFPLVLVGGGLLFWAAWRAQAYRQLISWSLTAALVFLLGGQALAVVTGLANATAQQPALWNPIVMGSIVLYDLTLIVAGVGGLLLVRDLFRATRQTSME